MQEGYTFLEDFYRAVMQVLWIDITEVNIEK